MGIKIELSKIKSFNKSYDFWLEEDVYADSGFLVVPAGKKLTMHLVRRLRNYGIYNISIAETETCPEELIYEPPVEKLTAVYPEKTHDFIDFQKNYDESTKKTGAVLTAVREGRQVDIMDTFNSLKTMIDKMKTKSDIFLFLNFIRGYDEHTFSHSSQVAMLSNVFGQWLNLPDDELRHLTLGGIFHDIGKTELPKNIITKPTKLTDEEFKKIKDHPLIGYNILQKFGMPKDVTDCAIMHHEKADGSGYPYSLRGKNINFYARIVTICDIYDAMTAKRVYRDKICPFQVIESLSSGMFGELDTELLFVFQKHIAQNYLHTKVELSTGETATVMFIHPTKPARPIVRNESDQFIDLAEHPEIKIIKLI